MLNHISLLLILLLTLLLSNRLSIVITNVSLLHEGLYSVKVSNSIGNSSTTQIVFVQGNIQDKYTIIVLP